jgi:hypothetical protein
MKKIGNAFKLMTMKSPFVTLLQKNVKGRNRTVTRRTCDNNQMDLFKRVYGCVDKIQLTQRNDRQRAALGSIRAMGDSEKVKYCQPLNKTMCLAGAHDMQ